MRPRSILTSVSNRVPLKHLLSARAFRQNLLASDEIFNATARALCQPIRSRLLRKRDLRKDLLIDFLRGWRQRVAEKPFHLAWSAQPDRKYQSVVLTECRLSAPVWQDCSWEQPAFEHGVSICRIQITAGHGEIICNAVPLVVLSQHALARRFERAKDIGEQAVLADIGDCARTDNWYEHQDDYVIDVAGGRWLGSCTSADYDGANGRTKIICYAVRTFIGPAELTLSSRQRMHAG